MERRFLKMMVEEGNCVRYAQGSSSRRIWGNRKRSWKGRWIITPIGPECGHLLLYTFEYICSISSGKKNFLFFYSNKRHMGFWLQNMTDLCWSRWCWTTHVSSKNTKGSAILSSSKCFIRKLGVDKCKKFEEIVQTKECDFKSLADVRDEKRIWSPWVSAPVLAIIELCV